MINPSMTSFLGDMNIAGGAEEGVHLTTTREGRATGEAYVELETQEDLDHALKKNKEHMGNRYIEGIVFFCRNIKRTFN